MPGLEMVGPPFLMLTLLTLMLPLRATLTLLSGCCNIFASYNAKLAVFFKFRFAFVVSCEFRFNGSGYAGIDGLSRIVDIRASAARIGIPRIGITRFSAACIRYCRIVVLLFVGDFVGTGILIVRADGPVAAAIVFEFDAITCFEADGRTSHFRSGCELGHVDGVRIGRTGGDIGNAARVDLSVGIGATDEDGG